METTLERFAIVNKDDENIDIHAICTNEQCAWARFLYNNYGSIPEDEKIQFRELCERNGYNAVPVKIIINI